MGFQMEYRFDVYGKMILCVTRSHGHWEVRQLVADGKRMLSDVVIPPAIQVESLERYLEELFHEWSTPERPEVIRLA